MPFTPPAARPMERTSVSRNSMACPSWLARKIICMPSGSLAPINSSLPSRLMAMMPDGRGLEDSGSPVFLHVPVLVLLETHQVADGFSAGRCRRFRNFVNLQPVHATLRSEQQDVAVRGRGEEVLDEI